MTETAENKKLVQQVFAALAEGDGRAFVEAMADDVSWTIAGSSAWSRTWRGKRAVLEELLGSLRARYADTYFNEAQRFIAEDDHVVVQCRGRVTTKSGLPYHNSYCFVMRLADGRLREITEYMDTDLALSALGMPD